MTPMGCCFTGHRPKDLPGGGDPNDPAARALIRRLDETVDGLCRQGVRDFYCGGALGFDTWAARAVLRHGEARLHLLLPCRGQEDGWSADHRAEYRAILEAAHEVTFLAEAYAPGCMQRRNRALVEHASVVVAYCVKETGGTAYTLKCAQKLGRRIILLSRGDEQMAMDL